MGADVQRFESELEAYLGRPVACVVNGTAALHLATQACGLKAGDEVVVQSLTYVSSFQAISATGAKPVACEVTPDSLTIDLRDAGRRLTSRTKAIMPVHYSGGMGELDDVYAFANDHKLRVIEDAAHAFGGAYKSRRVGSFGDIACFSFDGIKNITCGEGGAVVSDDAAVLQRVRDARLLGVERDTENRYEGKRSWEFDVTAQGFRYHMSNIMAAIGSVQLTRLPELGARRQRLALRYDQLLQDRPRIDRVRNDYTVVVPHIYTIRVRGLANRDDLRAQLLEYGIETGVHYQPNHLLSFFRDPQAAPLPITEALFSELLTLPLHPDLTDDDVDYICDRLLAAID